MKNDWTEKMEALIRENHDMKAAIRRLCLHAGDEGGQNIIVNAADLKSLASFLGGMKQ